MRLVLDTNVVLSGLIWHSHPRRLLDLAKEEAVSLYTSSALLDELADVLSREKWRAMLATRQTDAAYLMRRYGVLAKVIRPKHIGRAGRGRQVDRRIDKGRRKASRAIWRPTRSAC